MRELGGWIEFQRKRGTFWAKGMVRTKNGQESQICLGNSEQLARGRLDIQ